MKTIEATEDFPLPIRQLARAIRMLQEASNTQHTTGETHVRSDHRSTPVG